MGSPNQLLESNGGPPEPRRRRKGLRDSDGNLHGAHGKGTNGLTTPIIPERLHRLPELATDLWWTWNPQAREVFRKLDYQLWRQTAHNPVLMLQLVSQETVTQAAANERYLAIYDAAVDALEAARSARDTWWQHHHPDSPGPIAYSRRSSRSINHFQSTPAVWACWPAITAKKRAISGFR